MGWYDDLNPNFGWVRTAKNLPLRHLNRFLTLFCFKTHIHQLGDAIVPPTSASLFGIHKC